MSGVTCCPLSGGDGDGPDPETYTSKVVRRGQKEQVCSECGDVLPLGAEYQFEIGTWEDVWDWHRTCLSCVEIREHFACDGFTYGTLWSDLEENFFPDMKAGGPCIDGLSPAAKGRLFEKRLQWMFDSELEIDGARPPAPERAP